MCCAVCRQAAESGFKKRGSFAVSKVDANGYYYLNIAGQVGHRIRATLQVMVAGNVPALWNALCATLSP